MAFTDYGLIQLGSYIKGDVPTYPSYLEFGQGSGVFSGSTPYLNSGFMRKPIVWTWTGTIPVGNVVLLTTEGNGSTVNEIGIGPGSIVGSNIFDRELSAIGDKNSTFSTTLTFNVMFRRA